MWYHAHLGDSVQGAWGMVGLGIAVLIVLTVLGLWIKYKLGNRE